MITFVVTGNQWKREVEIDESDFEKYGDMAMEAMTRVTENILNNDEEAAWGLVMIAYEKGYEGDGDKVVACLTELIFRNAGYHVLAEQAKEQARKLIDQTWNSSTDDIN